MIKTEPTAGTKPTVKTKKARINNVLKKELLGLRILNVFKANDLSDAGLKTELAGILIQGYRQVFLLFLSYLP